MSGLDAGLEAEAIAARLALEPHPEGGFYRETFRAARTVTTERGERALSTAVLFLITADSPSRLHRLTADELWLYQAGAPLEMALISQAHPRGRRLVLGHPAQGAHTDGAEPGLSTGPAAPRKRSAPWSTDEGGLDRVVSEVLVPAGSWQGARLAEREAVTDAGRDGRPRSAAWTLVTCVVTPGFDFQDFEIGDRDALLREYPGAEPLIVRHT